MAADIDYARVLADLVATELARLRRSTVLHGELSRLSASTLLDEPGLGVDSLELLHLAGAVNELFHLHESSVQDYLLQHRRIAEWAEVVRASRAVAPERITFRTSGSTGESRPCVHRWSALEDEVRCHAARLPDVRRVITLVPSHHIFGFLFTALLPAHLHVPVVDARRWPASRLRAELQAGDLVISAPTFWQFLERSLATWPAGVRGITSTAPCPPRVFAALRGKGVALEEIYGSSETAGIARRVAEDDPFELLPLWTREGAGLRRTEGTLTSDTRDGIIALPDRLEWVDAQRFRLAGRVDGAVQVGGTNVFPAHVAERIRQHPAVAECAVRLMRPEEGDRLKAFVVWQPEIDAGVAPGDLQAWLQREFTTAERPVAIAAGPELPRNSLGKLTDWNA